MTERTLAARLRELRSSWSGTHVTQRQVADALGTSAPLVSSWESAAVVPPDERVRALARFFASRRSLEKGLLPDDQLTTEEERTRRALIDELIALRDKALSVGQAESPSSGALGGRFWHFPDGRPVMIVYNTFESLKALDYSQERHPNYIGSLANGDIDALLELVGHIRAENPGTKVTWKPREITPGAGPTQQSITSDDLTSHVVLIGGSVEQAAPGRDDDPISWLSRRLDLPVSTRLPEGGDQEYDTEFVVTIDDEGVPLFEGQREEVYRPIFLRDSLQETRPRTVSAPDDLGRQFPQLEYDVALLARQHNPLNVDATLSICSGVFSRGSYGAIRAMTDAGLRGRNEQFIYERFRDPDDRSALRPFWMLIHVPVLQGETITPDLNRPFNRLRSSS